MMLIIEGGMVSAIVHSVLLGVSEVLSGKVDVGISVIVGVSVVLLTYISVVEISSLVVDGGVE